MPISGDVVDLDLGVPEGREAGFGHPAVVVTAQRILDAVNDTGALLTHTRLDGRLVIRVSTGQARTEPRHLDAVWRAVVAASG